MTRGLPTFAARELRRMSPAQRRATALELAPRAAEASRGFRWGRDVERARVVRASLPPARVEIVCTLEAIEYDATKGRTGRATYVHDFDPPYAVIGRAATARSSHVRSSRGAPRPTRDVFELGPLRKIVGTSPNGESITIRPPAGIFLAADPVSRGLVIVNAGRARLGPLFVVRGRSHYRVRDEGIVG